MIGNPPARILGRRVNSVCPLLVPQSSRLGEWTALRSNLRPGSADGFRVEQIFAEPELQGRAQGRNEVRGRDAPVHKAQQALDTRGQSA